MKRFAHLIFSLFLILYATSDKCYSQLEHDSLRTVQSTAPKVLYIDCDRCDFDFIRTEITLEGSHYFHDISKNRLVLFFSLEIRLFKGFSVDIFSSISRIRDQLSLPKGEATLDEVLLQRRELATSYRYRSRIQLSYSFGSIFSSVVNPRLGH